jgi:methionine aminopeptidase
VIEGEIKPALRFHNKTAAEIVHGVMKKLIDLCVEGAKVLDICVEGDKLLEEGTGAVYNKSVKGVKVAKGMCQIFMYCYKNFLII